MARIRGFDVIAFSLVCAVGVYTGTQFFEPIVLDRLKKDGNLRKDIEVPEYDEEGNPAAPKSMMQLRNELNKIQDQRDIERQQKDHD